MRSCSPSGATRRPSLERNRVRHYRFPSPKADGVQASLFKTATFLSIAAAVHAIGIKKEDVPCIHERDLGHVGRFHSRLPIVQREVSVPVRMVFFGSYLGLDFVTEGRSLILHGKTGRGKTHLAVAIGYRAIQNGFEALFATAAELIKDLSNASKRGNLQESLTTYTHPHVLVIDEVGYLTYGPDAANVLFHVVNDRHLRKRPMIFTTNKPLNEWGKVLHDEDMAAAILDRVLERGRFIHLDGPSGRTRHINLEEILPAGADRARISGINATEFPEPTSALHQPAARRPQ